MNIGLPTVFVRTQGCNLRCNWCDTSYAWEAEGKEVGFDDIILRLERYATKRVCITGGEPLLQKDIFELLDGFHGYHVSIETNGSLDISGLVGKEVMISMDFKTPSSGMEREMSDHNLELLRPSDQLKFVIEGREDYLFSKDILMNYDIVAQSVFQPVWGSDISQIAEMVLEDDLDVRVLPQLHKYIWGEKRRV